MASNQIVVLHLADQEYGIEIDKVLEIIRYEKGQPIPEVPTYVEGIIRLRDEIYPIIDLRRRFLLPEAEKTPQNKIMIVKLETIQVGLVVDDVKEILELETSMIDTTPEMIKKYNNKYVKGVAKLEDKMLLMLDVEKILKDGEEEQLKEVKENM